MLLGVGINLTADVGTNYTNLTNEKFTDVILIFDEKVPREKNMPFYREKIEYVPKRHTYSFEFVEIF